METRWFMKTANETVKHHTELKSACGVYVLYLKKRGRKEVVLYVGASQNLKTRLPHIFKGTPNVYAKCILNHFRQHKKDYEIKVGIFNCKASELKDKEIEFIEYLRPMTNFQGGTCYFYKEGQVKPATGLLSR